MKKLLSKSKYLNGLQCLRLLWITINRPDLVPEPDVRTQHIFDQGHLVGDLAKKLYPTGIQVPDNDFNENLKQTQQLLRERVSLFEPGFLVDQIYSRLDVLIPIGTDEWDIAEVKSSTSVKDENLHDISFQKLCCEKSGLKINRCYLVYINNQYVRSGEINPQKMFTVEDVTERVIAAGKGIEERVKTMFDTLASPEIPKVIVGSHCNNPYDCSVTYCYDSLPENNILQLYRGGKKRFDLLYNGILKMRDIPGDVKLSKTQEIQKWCDTNKQPHVDQEAIRSFLNTLKYPLYFLDFETFNTAIPLYDGTRPYQQIPFQFSLHIDDGNSEVKHSSFLADGADDPRVIFAEELKKVIGDKGSIVTYNQAFEQRILTELGESFPQHKNWIQDACLRLVDLYVPFRSFSYYHPDQKGSASIKYVLPALTGKGYDEMEISNGDIASLAYLTMTQEKISEAEKQKIRMNLEKYCGLDTEGMIWIVKRLREIC